MTRLLAVVPAVTLCLVVVLVAARGEEIGSQEPQPVESEIRASLDAWTTAYAEGDLEALANLFVEDGVYLANTGLLMEGREAIRDGVRGFLLQRKRLFQVLGITDSTLSVEHEWIRFQHTAASAHVLGRFRVLLRPQNCVMDAGDFLAVWVRTGPTWEFDALLVTQVRTPPRDSCLGG